MLIWPQVLGDSCSVLFVVDGSSYWNSFRGEIISITTVANILYSTSNFTSNFWMYGDADQDDRIPTSFYSTEQDFLDNIQELRAYGGKETVVSATSKLNDWQTFALIVIYTASSQTLINVAGTNYTEQARTVAIHQNDGVDLRPISNYPSPQMSDYKKIADVINNACKDIPTKTTTPTTTQPTTTTAEPITSSGPVCVMFFYLDGSIKGDTNNGLIQQYVKIQSILGTQPFFDSATYAAAAYGQLPDTPLNLTTTDRNGLNDDLQIILGGTNTKETVQRAINEMNSNTNLNTSFVTILFTNSDQADIDNAPANNYKPRTLGISIEGQAMGNIADYAFDLSSNQDLIASILFVLCNGQTPTKVSPASTDSTTATTATTTTTPLIPCRALFIADVSNATGAVGTERTIMQVSGGKLFGDSALQFTAAVWSYGDYSQIGDLPENFVNTTADFVALLDGLSRTTGTDDVKFATTKVNAWDKTNTVIVLFTASPQSVINDAATTYQRFSATVGVSITAPANDMSPLAAITKEFADPTGVSAAIRQTCLNLRSATPRLVPKNHL